MPSARPSALYTPHPPTADPFADTWYAYLHDPGLGYLKVAWMSYLNEHTTGGHQHAYVHVAHAPVEGGHHEVDHWSREVVSESQPERGAGAFRFEVPGCASIDESHIRVDLPGSSTHIELEGPPVPWFPPPDVAASPFLGPGTQTGDTSHWFVHTLGTPARWRHGDAEGHRLVYIERGWSVRQAFGFAYVLAVAPEATVVLAGGMADDTTRIWAGRVRTAEHDLTFLPFAEDVTTSDDLDPGAARAEVTLRREDVEVRITTQAPLEDFYDQITPSLTVFHAEHPVAKTMKARLHVEVARGGDVVEVIDLPQSIFELGGILYPVGLDAARPTYDYTDRSS